MCKNFKRCNSQQSRIIYQIQQQLATQQVLKNKTKQALLYFWLLRSLKSTDLLVHWLMSFRLLLSSLERLLVWGNGAYRSWWEMYEQVALISPNSGSCVAQLTPTLCFKWDDISGGALLHPWTLVGIHVSLGKCILMSFRELVVSTERSFAVG